jgi:hypothetical protein
MRKVDVRLTFLQRGRGAVGGTVVANTDQRPLTETAKHRGFLEIGPQRIDCHVAGVPGQQRQNDLLPRWGWRLRSVAENRRHAGVGERQLLPIQRRVGLDRFTAFPLAQRNQAICLAKRHQFAGRHFVETVEDLLSVRPHQATHRPERDSRPGSSPFPHPGPRFWP